MVCVMIAQLLDEIAERFYGVRRRSGLQGIFGDLFKVCCTIHDRLDILLHHPLVFYLHLEKKMCSAIVNLNK